jgi:GTP-binding protein
MMRVLTASFVASAFQPTQLPDETLPEVAFAGRSNVGKSSLLNRLLGRRSLVRVSSRPGFTQSINFFLVNEAVYFVDLPGYGFASAPKAVKRNWHALVEAYLQDRRRLRGVVCILDIRRRPDRMDLDLLDYLSSKGKGVWVVLNKADKIPQPKRIRQIKSIRQALPSGIEEAVVVSARTGEGTQGLLETIWDTLEEPET